MPDRPRSRLARYGVALSALALALALRWALDPLLGEAVPYVTVFGALAVAVWYGGAGPGVLAAVLGYALVNPFFTEPRGRFGVFTEFDAASLLGYTVSAALIVALGEAMHVARRRVEASERELAERLAQIEGHLEAQEAQEEALRSAREQMQIVTDTMASAICRSDASGRIVWANRAYEQWMGAEPGSLNGRRLAEVIGEAAMRDIGRHVERVMAGEAARYERLVDYPGFRNKWIYASLTPTLDAAGRPDGWVAVLADIDDRKRVEEALKEADSRKNQFLATVAHELRNPLAPIRNAVAVLRRKGSLDAELAWSRDVIDRQAEHMARLVDDLVDVERIGRGALHIAKEPMDLERAIDMALESSRAAINAAGHFLSVELPSERVRLEADPVRLAQAISHLLVNAAKYTAPGGAIALAAWAEGGEAVISVEDEGMGFEPEAAARLFDSRARLAHAHGRGHGGLGVGLTLVRGIAALHGGSVAAKSAGPGKGSQFTLRIPLGSPRGEAAAPAAPAPQALRVLIADDNRDAADSLQRVLALLGHEVHAVYDGPACVEAAKAFRPEAAVVDIGMPGMDGYQVARTLRERFGRALVLVALTGWGQEGDRRRAMEAGFDFHLTKPVDPAALNDVLKKKEAREAA